MENQSQVMNLETGYKPPKVILDKERTLILNLNAFVDFESVTGRSIFDPKILDKLSLSDVIKLLWAGLHQEDDTLTIKDVGAMLNFENFPEITKAIALALKPLSEARPVTNTEK